MKCDHGGRPGEHVTTTNNEDSCNTETENPTSDDLDNQAWARLHRTNRGLWAALEYFEIQLKAVEALAKEFPPEDLASPFNCESCHAILTTLNDAEQTVRRFRSRWHSRLQNVIDEEFRAWDEEFRRNRERKAALRNPES